MATALHTAVRALHVVAAALLVGGSAATWNALRNGDAAQSLLVQFEWAFWPTVGVLPVTGVGNLGALGPPGPATRWGAVLTAKLGVVLLLVFGSAVRTLAVLAHERRDRPPAAGTALRRGYAATAVTLLALVVLAEVLAHG